MFHDGYVTPAYRQAGSNHEHGPLVAVRVKVRRPVWAKGKGYGQRFKAK